MEYNDRHRSFLQAVANHGSLTLSHAKKLLSFINAKYEEQDNEQNLDRMVKEINAKIAPYDQEIKYIKHDLLNKEFIVFANTVEDEIHMMQSYYNELDRNYFRLILREITLNEMSIQRIVALNLIAHLKPKPFHKNHGEELIDGWIETGYFTEQNDLIYFGPKTLAEFSNYLKKNYTDFVSNCFLCLTATIMGISCDDCEQNFHRDCLKKALRVKLICPACKIVWDKTIP